MLFVLRVGWVFHGLTKISNFKTERCDLVQSIMKAYCSSSNNSRSLDVFLCPVCKYYISFKKPISQTCWLMPNALGSWVSSIAWAQEFKTNLGNIGRLFLYQYIFICLPGVMVHICIPSCSEGWGRRITWTREVKATVSWDCTIAIQPG